MMTFAWSFVALDLGEDVDLDMPKAMTATLTTTMII